MLPVMALSPAGGQRPDPRLYLRDHSLSPCLSLLSPRDPGLSPAVLPHWPAIPLACPALPIVSHSWGEGGLWEEAPPPPPPHSVRLHLFTSLLFPFCLLLIFVGFTHPRYLWLKQGAGSDEISLRCGLWGQCWAMLARHLWSCFYNTC